MLLIHDREHYERLSSFERGHAIGLKKQEDQIVGSVVIWVKMTSQFDNVDSNGSTTAEQNVKNAVVLQRND